MQIIVWERQHIRREQCELRPLLESVKLQQIAVLYPKKQVTKMWHIALILAFMMHTPLVLTCPAWSLMNGCSVPINSTSFPYKTFFHEACQRHDVCYSCGDMHGWSRISCDDGFYADMITACKDAGTQLRKRRHIQDFMPLLRHKFKGSLKALQADDSTFSVWGTVCEAAAGVYFHTVRLFGNCFYASPSSDVCRAQCAIDGGKPNVITRR